MKRAKRILVSLVGLAVVLCAIPVFAEKATMSIPYAQHQGKEGWWAGLALSNQGKGICTVTIYRTNGGTKKEVYKEELPAYSMKTDFLDKFFKAGEYPTENGGRVSLIIEADGDSTKADFRAILFTGNPEGGFGFASYKDGD